jgi:uncharacterized protein (TIGR02611 family)
VEPERVPEIVQRLDRRRAAYRRRSVAYRVVWCVAGFAVLAAGLAMVVLPGPAVVVVPLGLAMLSFQFSWAQRLLDTVIERGAEARRRARGRKRLVVVAAVAIAAAAAVCAALLVYL